MDLGLTMFATSTAGVIDVARRAEERGFESLFLPEHSHIPARENIQRPRGGDLPEEYRHIFDPLIALAAISSMTTRLRLGTGICLVTQRDPILLAKELSTLDVLSQGRMILGTGAGWLVEEMANHGTDARHRFAILRERILAMRMIWTSEVAEFHGEYVNFGPLWQWPKPHQVPHLPVLLGGDGPGIVDRLLDYADGWLPFPGQGDEQLMTRIEEVRSEVAARSGRSFPVTVFGAAPDASVLEQYRALGVDRCVLWLPRGSGDEVLRALDTYAELVC